MFDALMRSTIRPPVTHSCIDDYHIYMIYYRNIVCAAHGRYVTSDDTSALSHEKKRRQRGRGAFRPPDDARNRRQGPAGENSRYGQGFRRSLSFLLRFLYIYPFFPRKGFYVATFFSI